MTAMQEEVLGGVITLMGQGLAYLIAFAHNDEEQKKLTEKQIPKRFYEMLNQRVFVSDHPGDICKRVNSDQTWRSA